ncbi:hypothetical protein HMPREF1979_01054 [Actinomyces johnsonii F0542]|uniref:Uncharacterized protein n=1 Tax=Actinomyces johnsonii F0542 TaxID=1321818 RepID=U1RYP6_9ACTO|nr:hypothetical protein HMPREF1979_01054 [Actinomyces johnsonii F0542]
MGWALLIDPSEPKNAVIAEKCFEGMSVDTSSFFRRRGCCRSSVPR